MTPAPTATSLMTRTAFEPETYEAIKSMTVKGIGHNLSMVPFKRGR